MPDSELTFEKYKENIDTVYKDLLEAGWKWEEIENTEIFELYRILNQSKSKNVKTVGANESLIGAITGTDPRDAG
ncbi:hypothetical protein MT339_09005 [Staphylococcus sp. NRL 19/737]|nr:hypothetical protein [Staphylococcus sp. NRL 19/737]MCJ1668534.1 hypothetical protein [Staphylococcus sp. NRL 19/737]